MSASSPPSPVSPSFNRSPCASLPSARGSSLLPHHAPLAIARGSLSPWGQPACRRRRQSNPAAPVFPCRRRRQSHLGRGGPRDVHAAKRSAVDPEKNRSRARSLPSPCRTKLTVGRLCGRRSSNVGCDRGKTFFRPTLKERFQRGRRRRVGPKCQLRSAPPGSGSASFGPAGDAAWTQHRP